VVGGLWELDHLCLLVIWLCLVVAAAATTAQEVAQVVH
jgi:hypothetical protein